MRAVLLLVLLALVAYPLAVGTVGYRGLQRVGPLPESALAATPGHTVLLVGSDSREGLTQDQEVQLSTGSGDEISGKRTDTIVLLHRPSSGGPTVLLSLPRDSYLDVPGHGQNRINAAYSLGGPALLTQTVEQATGLKVDAYAETGLAGFAGIVDAVGGVEMCPPAAIVDPKAGLDIPAGCQRMDGPTALGYARTRSTAGGDFDRVQRQRELIAAIAAEAASPATLLNPFRAFPVASAAGGALSVDDGSGPLALGQFALAFRSVASGTALSLTVPVADAARRTGSGAVVVDWDAAQADVVFEALRTGDTESLRPIAEAQLAG